MPAPPAVIELVARFQLHREEYKAARYNETQVRREFIDPLFKALGWDIDNEQGYAEAYKDVVHEDAIQVGRSTKAPDYAFRIGGVRKFFLEAKRPSTNIRDGVGPAYQLRRYAWSAKLPLSILTDFEELAVYDCRVRPQKNDKANVARIAYYTLQDYIEKWDELQNVFSREAILKGSFDRYADDNKRKRGTTEVDDAFLEELERWRAALARNIALRNPALSVRELNAAVQRTLDRIIFLRIAEDRGIETYGQLRDLVDTKGVYVELTHLFRDADARYNSGLFHFRKGDGPDETLDTFTLELQVDDKALKPILRSLYYPDSPYEFSVLPADILGHVYERFLGKIIRLKGKRASIEEKPEVKKAGGVYYTPGYVVRYIVENTIGNVLAGTTPLRASGLDNRVKNPMPLRILDPACGSGSFLIGAYQYLLDWYLEQYLKEGTKRHAKGKSPKLYQVGKGDWRLSVAERQRILLTHIYGVDIDPQAVEITKLSLLLKVLEGEAADAVAHQMDFFQIRALPDLASNIRCGNSLVGPDFYEVYPMNLFSDDDQVSLNAFHWHDEFPFLKAAGGFHCVIGNPPYLYSAGQAKIEYFEKNYRYTQYQTDYYVYFTERALNLIRSDGVMGFIVPDSWLNLDSFSVMRAGIVNEWNLVSVCTFGYKVFRDANIENTILIVENNTSRGEVEVVHFESPTSFDTVNKLKVEDINRLDMIDPHYSREAEVIIEKMDEFEKLGNLVLLNRGIHAYRTDGYGRTAFGTGPQTKKDKELKSYHSSSRKNKSYLPEVRGRDVFWLSYQYSGEFVSYGDWLAEPRNPKFIRRPKVVFRKTLGGVLSAAYIEEAAAVDQALYIAISKDGDEDMLKFALGVLGSAVGAWYLRTKYSIYDRLHPWYTKRQLENFPMPDYSEDIVRIVNRLLKVCETERSSKIDLDRRQARVQRDALTSQLDDVVLDGYGLSVAQKRRVVNAKRK